MDAEKVIDKYGYEFTVGCRISTVVRHLHPKGPSETIYGQVTQVTDIDEDQPPRVYVLYDNNEEDWVSANWTGQWMDAEGDWLVTDFEVVHG